MSAWRSGSVFSISRLTLSTIDCTFVRVPRIDPRQRIVTKLHALELADRLGDQRVQIGEILCEGVVVGPGHQEGAHRHDSAADRLRAEDVHALARLAVQVARETEQGRAPEA
jgi:hypothetical protein